MVLLGKTVQFTATGGAISSWTVNGISGGSAAVGSITSAGLYTAPAILPTSTTVSIGAVSGNLSASATVNLQSDITVGVSSSSANPILTSSSIPLTATVTSAGVPSTAVTWTVGGVPNGNATVGTISALSGSTATYIAPAAQPSASIQIIATSVADPSKSAAFTRTVQGILLSASSGVPGQPLTLTGHFVVGTPVSITFTDVGSFSQTLSVTPATSTSVSTILPMYCTSAGLGIAGTLTVSASQGTGTSAIGSSPGFALAALPAVSGTVGAVTTAVFTALSTDAAQSAHMWDAEAKASNGKLASTAIHTPLADMNLQMHKLLASTATASTTPVFLAKQGSSNLQLTAANMSLLDSIFQAYILGNANFKASFSAIPAANLRAMGYGAGQVLTPLEQFRAMSLFSGISNSINTIPKGDWKIIVAITTLAFITPSLPVVAVAAGLAAAYGAVAAITENGTYTNASSIGNGSSPSDGYSLSSQSSSALAAGISSAAINGISAIFSSLSSDASAAELDLNQGDPNSFVNQAVSAQPTIISNLPTPVVNPIISDTTDITSISNGGSIVDVSFQGVPDTTYQVTSTWGSDTYGIQTDDFGYGYAPVEAPAPISGPCLNGSVSLANSSGSTVSSQSGCFQSSSPVITSVSGIVAAQSQSIVIIGTGFGTHAPYSGSSSFFSLADITQAFGAGYGGDTVGVAVTSWTDTQIILGGFTGSYGSGQNQYQLQSGDELLISVANPVSGAGPASCVLITGGGGVFCP